MQKLIKNGAVIDDRWTTLPSDVADFGTGPVIVSLETWAARKAELLARGGELGIWLNSHQPPEEILADLSHFSLIALNFPKWTDGRAYTYARLLRERHGFTGEIRAIGDVMQDQMFYMKRCGFDAFAVRADKDISKALQSLNDFRDAYQPAVDQNLPHFRRIFG